MSEQPTASRVPDFHKSAFWIYGVTAMVMREPLAIVLRHAATAGWADQGVQMEAARSLIVWLLLSRQFTVAGIYFDHVYVQSDSAARFPQRSYPVDFMLGVVALLVSVGASTIVGVSGPLFDVLVGLTLLWDLLWLAFAKALGHSTARFIAPAAIFNLGVLAVFLAVREFFGPLAGYGALVLCGSIQMARLFANYNRLYAGPAQKS